MRGQVVRLSVGQTSKVLAVLYGVMGLVFIPIVLLVAMVDPESAPIGLGFAIFLALLYAGLGYVFTAISCMVYNAVARFVGGIEIEMEGVEQPVA